MSNAKNDKIDVLIEEVRELKSEIKELRMLLMYKILKMEDSRFRGSDTLLALTKLVLKGALEQLADLECKTDVQARPRRRPPKESANARKDASKPTIDVDKEIAILKKEMATSLRNAAKEIDDAEEEREGTG